MCVSWSVSLGFIVLSVAMVTSDRDLVCVSDCRISRSEDVMLKVGIDPHWKLRQTKMGTELNLEASLVLLF